MLRLIVIIHIFPMLKPKAKSRFLLDSDISIWIIRGDSKTIEAVSKIANDQPVVISILTVSEIYKNSFSEEEPSNRYFFRWHNQLPINFAIAKLAGEYWNKYRSVNINLIDYLIAATCKINRLTLLTMNTKHYPMKDIKVINPNNA